jgi:hypothetical protein
MALLRGVVLVSAAAACLSTLGAGVANADSYIDFGTNQSAFKSAARQANSASGRRSYCHETGPGHYTLYLAG